MKVLILALITMLASQTTAFPLSPEFVSINDVDPSILLDIRYHSTHNFIGDTIHGYQAGKCLLTRQAAKALQAVQREIQSRSLSLKVYDCYRPQKAVSHFVKWAKATVCLANLISVNVAIQVGCNCCAGMS